MSLLSPSLPESAGGSQKEQQLSYNHLPLSHREQFVQKEHTLYPSTHLENFQLKVPIKLKGKCL